MMESQFRCVQHHAIGRNNRLLEPSDVNFLPNNRMARFAQVDANLVSPAGFNTAGD